MSKTFRRNVEKLHGKTVDFDQFKQAARRDKRDRERKQERRRMAALRHRERERQWREILHENWGRTVPFPTAREGFDGLKCEIMQTRTYYDNDGVAYTVRVPVSRFLRNRGSCALADRMERIIEEDEERMHDEDWPIEPDLDTFPEFLVGDDELPGLSEYRGIRYGIRRHIQ